MVSVDVLEFVALADKSKGLPFSRQTHSLGNAFDIVTPIDPASGYGQWKHVKNVQGWPWDIKLYDNDYIYDWITEKSWTDDNRAYKKFIQNHPSIHSLKFEDGLIMFPRHIRQTNVAFDIDIPVEQSQYSTFVDCQHTRTDHLGPIHQRLRGPFLIDHGGDVGPQLTIIHQYYWSNNGVLTLEENHFAQNYGWVAWKLQTYVNDAYKSMQTTISNKLAPGTPKIEFPCF